MAKFAHVADGTVEGIILDAPRGTGGFGYDPLFYLPELDRTMAEIDLANQTLAQPPWPRVRSPAPQASRSICLTPSQIAVRSP